MEEAKRVSIHIAALNHAAFLPTCLASLDAQQDQGFQMVVVDSSSHDGAGAWLREHRPDVIVMRQFHSPSFARSHEQAITFALSRWPAETYRDRYVLFLKSDIILPPETLDRMVRAMAADTDLAAVGPRVFLATALPTEEGEPQEIEYTESLLSLGWLMKKTRVWSPVTDPAQKDQMFSPPFECLLVRASALQSIHTTDGYMDETLGESAAMIDLIWRLRLTGGKVETLETARVWRRKSDTRLSKVPPTERRRILIDHWLVAAKNDATTNRWIHGSWLLLDRIRFLGHLFLDLRLWAGLGAVLGARFRLRKKRQAIMAQAKVSPQEVRRWFV